MKMFPDWLIGPAPLWLVKRLWAFEDWLKGHLTRHE